MMTLPLFGLMDMYDGLLKGLDLMSMDYPKQASVQKI